MFDMHCHILWDVDDGAKDFFMTTSICMLSEKQGIKYIVATPHFIIDEIEQSKDRMEVNIKLINNWCNEAGVKVQVFLGCESYIHPLLPQYVKEGKVPTINNSRYLLVEFPMDEMPIYTEEILYKLMLMGITPIIAHPERYSYFIDKPQQLYAMVEKGCIVQCNGGSFLGHFGKDIQDFSFNLLKHNMVHIIGSDSHNDLLTGRGACLGDAYTIIKEANFGDISVEMIMDNGDRIISDKELSYVEPIPFKKVKFKKIRGLLSKFF